MRTLILFTCILLSFTLLFAACEKEADCIDESLIDADGFCFLDDVRGYIFFVNSN